MRKEKYFIDLSKLSEEQLKEVEKVSGWNIKHIQTFPILSLRFSTLCQYGKDSDWVKARTELTYPDFIKLFESGEGENNGWIKIGDDGKINYNGLMWGVDKSGFVHYFSEDDFIEIGCLTHYQPLIEKLEAEKKELLEALEKAHEYLEEIGMVVPNKEWTEQFRDRWNLNLHEIESLIQKHNQ